jgi:hypothetical protein
MFLMIMGCSTATTCLEGIDRTGGGMGPSIFQVEFEKGFECCKPASGSLLGEAE